MFVISCFGLSPFQATQLICFKRLYFHSTVSFRLSSREGFPIKIRLFSFFADQKRWWYHSLLTYLTHPHPIFRCIRCDKYYMKCHYHLTHNNLYFPFLYPCNPTESNRHAQIDSSPYPCRFTRRDPRYIFHRFYKLS